jgi:hypothetical protein
MNNSTFTYQVTKFGKVFLFWDGKRIKILDGNAAQKFWTKIDGLDESETQLLMAIETGNFERGDERQGKRAQNMDTRDLQNPGSAIEISWRWDERL